jgi:biopolymer transport protein ExbD
MKRKMRSKSEVELNLASMLDMAFQLLSFFIMTFQFPPEEGQIRMHMPPPQAVFGEGTQQAGDTEVLDPKVRPAKTLVVSVGADSSGKRTMMAVGGGGAPETFKSLGEMGRRVGEILRKAGTPYEQVLIQVDPRLEYGQLMEVMAECAKQKTSDDPNSPNLTKLSFVSASKPKKKD